MTEARRYLQEAPREGAADLVARASVTRARAGEPRWLQVAVLLLC